jgi:hypothetical protein
MDLLTRFGARSWLCRARSPSAGALPDLPLRRTDADARGRGVGPPKHSLSVTQPQANLALPRRNRPGLLKPRCWGQATYTEHTACPVRCPPKLGSVIWKHRAIFNIDRDPCGPHFLKSNSRIAPNPLPLRCEGLCGYCARNQLTGSHARRSRLDWSR